MVSLLESRHFGIVSQVYPPDPAAVGQHLADVAEELVRRGHRVSVFTSDRAYDDPTVRFARIERTESIRITRLPFSSFGKGSLVSRLASGISLLTQAACLATFDVRITDLLLSTTPHLCGALGVALRLLRGIPFHYWLMDLNPDQIVAAGRLSPSSPAVRGFDWLNRQILERAESITALDPAMATRFSAKGPFSKPLHIQPPWAVQEGIAQAANYENSFRAANLLMGKRVVMHAGNHSAVHPLDTLVEAIRRVPTANMRYVFAGGGVGKKSIEQWVEREHPGQVLLLPYQPRERVAAMLSAADVHVVAVGNGTVGIVHPSKIYGALAASRPVIVFGPAESPAARLVLDFGVGWHVEHGDVVGASRVLAEIEALSEDTLLEFKLRAQHVAETKFSRQIGVGAFCDRLIERSES